MEVSAFVPCGRPTNASGCTSSDSATFRDAFCPGGLEYCSLYM
jgi:hypothetical protein